VGALIFGSAFLWIALALRSIDPGTVAFGRVLLGVLALGTVGRARRLIARMDLPRIVVASFFGMAAPALLFALAEERISSALTGMLISSAPIITAVVTAAATRARPTRRRVVGLMIGFIGIVMLTAPDLSGADAEPLGVTMALAGVVCYAIASMLYAPLQQTYGALPVTLWVLAIATVMLAPLGVIGLSDSTWEATPVLALLVLGIVGTGAAWVLFVVMVGKVGAVRASVIGYVIPIVALLLGVAVLDEHIGGIQVVGVFVALGGGFLVSRGRDH
jgi:drug/metabolite transporter (DMT)-like permease